MKGRRAIEAPLHIMQESILVVLNPTPDFRKIGVTQWLYCFQPFFF
jgi:hypothetical protein